jgi:hypothetical protein
MPKPNPIRERTAVRSAAAALALLTTGCGEGGPYLDRDLSDSGDRTPGKALACTVTETARHPIVLPNGREAYVEVQGLHPLADGFLVLGSPSFEWLRSSGGIRTRVGQDEFLGAFFDARGRITETIAMPPQVGHFDWVNSAPLNRDGFAVLLPEVSEPFPTTNALIRMVYAEYRRGEWSLVETLPAPAGRLRYSSGSRLLATEDGLVWVVPHEHRVLLYERRNGTWTYRSIAERTVDKVVLRDSPDHGLWIGLAGVDPAHAGQPVSLRLQRVDSDSESLEVHRLPGGGRIRRPRIAIGVDGLAVGWIVERAEGSSAWAAVGVRSGRRPSPMFLHGAARDVVPVQLPGRGIAFLANHVNPITGKSELRAYLAEGRRLRPIGSIPNPYVTFFDAVALSATDVLLVGPEYDSASIYPFVRSLVLRLSISCS